MYVYICIYVYIYIDKSFRTLFTRPSNLCTCIYKSHLVPCFTNETFFKKYSYNYINTIYYYYISITIGDAPLKNMWRVSSKKHSIFKKKQKNKTRFIPIYINQYTI